MSLNRVFIMGNLGADPELRYTPSKIPVCTCESPLVNAAKIRKASGLKPLSGTRLSSGGKTAENCSQYLQKGRQVFVEGRLQTRKW